MCFYIYVFIHVFMYVCFYVSCFCLGSVPAVFIGGPERGLSNKVLALDLQTEVIP